MVVVDSIVCYSGFTTFEIWWQRCRDGGDLEQNRRLFLRTSQMGRGGSVLRKSKKHRSGETSVEYIWFRRKQ